MSEKCEEWFYMSLEELSVSFKVKPEDIVEIIEEGIITRPAVSRQHWQFDTDAFRKIRTVLRLKKDLGVNLAGAGLALELIDEIERLHHLLSTQSK